MRQGLASRLLRIHVLRVDRRLILSVAISLAMTNLLVNRWTIEAVFSPDHHVSPRTAHLLFVYNLLSLGGSVLLVLLRNRIAFALRVYHVLVGLALAEASIRLVLFVPSIRVPWIENPMLYADPYCSDDYWVLYHYYPDASFPTATHVDSRYGWTVGATDGVGAHGPVDDDPAQARLLVFGDSFMRYGGETGRSIPGVMEERLGPGSVANRSVSGWGVDQICLRFKDEYPRYRQGRPLVLLGILLEDLDRSLLSFRGCQKPRYDIVDGRLVLHPPGFATNQAYIDAYHFHGTSFVVSALGQFVRRVLRLDCSASRREEVNRKVIADAVAFAKANDCRLYFVVFYAQNGVLVESAREISLRRIFDQLEVQRIVDTKPMLLRLMKERQVEVAALYGADDHHTSEVNEAIGNEIIRTLRRLGEIR